MAIKQPRFVRVRQVVIALALCLGTAPALAGVADSPLPVLQAGKRTYHLYSVPGALDRSAIDLATYFACTSTDTATMQVGVEVFDSNAYLLNDAAATSFSLLPGHSVLFGTHQGTDELYNVNLNTGSFSAYSGSARILATSKKLVCTAFQAWGSPPSPSSIVHLTVVKKTKQKGE